MISDYRSKNILKRYQVTPIKPGLILLAEVSMYIVYSFISLMTLFFTAVIFFDFKMRGSFGLFLLGYLLVMASIFSIGIMVGGISPNAKIASVIASILYFPMLIFSGATLPYEVMPEVMQRVVNVLPLTQGIKILKCAILGQSIENVGISIGIMLMITVLCSFVGIKFFRWE